MVVKFEKPLEYFSELLPAGILLRLPLEFCQCEDSVYVHFQRRSLVSNMINALNLDLWPAGPTGFQRYILMAPALPLASMAHGIILEVGSGPQAPDLQHQSIAVRL